MLSSNMNIVAQTPIPLDSLCCKWLAGGQEYGHLAKPWLRILTSMYSSTGSQLHVGNRATLPV